MKAMGLRRVRHQVFGKRGIIPVMEHEEREREIKLLPNWLVGSYFLSTLIGLFMSTNHCEHLTEENTQRSQEQHN